MIIQTPQDYLRQFVNRIPELLKAHLSRETRSDLVQCSHCTAGNLAIWRCQDCTLSTSLCRKCIRETHRPAPFHRIQSWNGSYFRPASLWEVGTYILVPHLDSEGEPLCETLNFQKNFLDSQQVRVDDEEQESLRNKRNMNPASGPIPNITEPESEPFRCSGTDPDTEMSWNDEAQADAAFEAGLNSWLNDSPSENVMDLNVDSEDAIADIPNVIEYLGPYKDSTTNTANIPGPIPDHGCLPDSDTGPSRNPGTDSDNLRPNADGLNNSYVRVIHTNGIHHIGLVTCSCRGQDRIPLDLVACRLFPASFVRIRTIFTAQLMDYFRLCNLELKASAYQFYQLIRRLTLPIGHSEVVNLYHEFRRTSRIWRWMKKLKWAGYGHNKQDPFNPPAGSLSIFCPTCPQPKVNLPEDWKHDKNR